MEIREEEVRHNIENDEGFFIQDLTPENSSILAGLRERIDGINNDKAQDESNKYALGKGGRKAFVIFGESLPVGYLELKLEEELPEKAPRIKEIEKYAHFARIGVVEEARKKGLATKLMKMAERWVKQQGKIGIWLDYLTTNIPAEKFYQKLGFRKIASFTDIKGKDRNIATKALN